MNHRMISEQITSAIAIYICITAIKNCKFMNDINLDHISSLLGASFSEREKAKRRAMDFIGYFQ